MPSIELMPVDSSATQVTTSVDAGEVYAYASSVVGAGQAAGVDIKAMREALVAPLIHGTIYGLPIERRASDQAVDMIVNGRGTTAIRARLTTQVSSADVKALYEELAVRIRLRLLNADVSTYSRINRYQHNWFDIDPLDSATPPLDIGGGQPIADRFQSLISRYRTDFKSDTFLALKRQISSLLGDEDDLADAGIVPSLVSFEGFLHFLKWNADAKHPNLSLDRGGNFVASWSCGSRSKLSLIFIGLTKGRWLAVDRSDVNLDRASGVFDSDFQASVPGRFRAWMFA